MSAETSPAPSLTKPAPAATTSSTTAATTTATASAMVTDSPLPSTVMHSHKSYRRKYRKIMVKFERQMRESRTLFEDDQKIQDISQRLAEQNDQLLSLLLELNNHPQVPGRLRYDLRDPSDTREITEHTDTDAATTSLRVSRHRVSKGENEQGDYEDYAQSLLQTVEFAPQRSYAKLLKHVQLAKSPNEDSQEMPTPMAGGFLSRKQEEQYLNSLDMWCNRQAIHPRSHALGNLGSKSSDKSADREREMQLKNPVSVYNWLRKNQPQVFLQDAETEKPKIAAAARKSKRESMPKATKAEPEFYDADGIALENTATKGKRKRDDDGGYRPKGGHARPNKRRKDEGGRRSKRASMDISGN